MIRVLIVEDEPPILRNIKKLIQNCDSDFIVAGTAYNGREAIQIIENDVPDILITDIRMPIMDGLCLLQHVKEHYPYIISVILSGYDDFEYARKSLHLGVFDYLLKPISEQEVQDLLHRIKIHYIRRCQDEMLSFLSSLIYEDTNAAKLHNSCLVNRDLFYYYFTACAGPFPLTEETDMLPGAQYWNRNPLSKTVQSLLTAEESGWVVQGKTGCEMVGLIGLRSGFDSFCKSLLPLFGNEDIPVTFVFSHMVYDLSAGASILKDLRKTIRKRLVPSYSQIISITGSIRGNHDTMASYGYLDENIVTAFSEGRLADFYTQINLQISSWWEQRLPQRIIEKLLKQYAFECAKTLPLPLYSTCPHLQLDEEIEEAISNSVSADDLSQEIRFIFASLFNFSSNKPEQKRAYDRMYEVGKYLEQNYMKPITSQSLARRFGYVPTYLSRLFREYKGVTPANYITELRIQAAAELIKRGGELRVREIAESVGYQDVHYFCKIFKKATGLTPSQYRASQSK